MLPLFFMCILEGMMNVTLDPDKSAFCTIGKLAWTFGEPGPHSVDVSKLSEAEARQLLYNIKRGVLKTDDSSELEQLLDVAPRPNYTTPNEVPLRKPPKIEDALEEDVKELKKILASTVATIKKESQKLRPGRLRKLLALEEEGKARKSVLSFLSELVASHTQSVTSAIGSIDLISQDRLKINELSTQLTDIVESEVEEVTFNLPEESTDSSE